MAKPKADVDLVTDVRQSLEAMRKYQARMGQMLDDMDHRLRRVDKRGDQVGKQFNKITGAIGRAAMGMAGFGSAVQAVKTVVEKLREQIDYVKNIDNLTKDKHTEFVVAREHFRSIALSHNTNLDMETADDIIMRSVIPDKAKLYRSAADLISSQMTTKPKEILEGLSRLADLRPDLSFEDDALKQVTIGVQNLQNAAPETTYEEQIAQFFAGMLQSRVTDPSAYNRYIVTAIVRNMQMGMSQQYATTMNNAITTALNDEYGQISSTIGTNLPIDMATIQQSMGLKTHGDEWLTRVWEPDDIAEEIRKRYSARLMAVLSDHDLTDEERAALEAYGSGEGHGRLVGKSAAMTLLMPSDNPTTAYQRFQEGLKMMPVGQEAIDFLAKKYKERDKDPHYWAMRTGMGVENLANAQLLDPYSSLRANLEKAIENISMAGRSKKLGMELTKMFQTWNQEQLDSNQVLDTMQNKAEWTLEQLKYDIDYAKTRGGGRDQSGRPVSEYDSNRVLQLEVFLDLLKDIRKGINGVEKNTGKKPAKLNDPAPAFIPLDTQ